MFTLLDEQSDPIQIVCWPIVSDPHLATSKFGTDNIYLRVTDDNIPQDLGHFQGTQIIIKNSMMISGQQIDLAIDR